MSRNSKKTFEIKHKKRIDNAVKTLYRILKERKLFGAFIQTHSPLTEDDEIIIGRKIQGLENGHGVIADVDGLEFKMNCMNEKERDFKNWISDLYLTKVQTRKKRDVAIPHSLTSSSMLSYICDDYFKRNKDKYSVKISRLHLETIFGLIYVFIGLSLMSLVIFHLIGFGGVVVFMLLVEICSLYGMIKLKATQIY